MAAVSATTPASATEDARRAARARTRARDRKRSALLWLTRVVVLVIALGLWEIGSGRVLNPFWFSAPSAIVGRLAQWVVTGELWRHLVITFQETGAGFVIGAFAGVVVGITFGSMPFLAKVFDPLILGLYSLPKIALAPLFIIWFGLDMLPKIVLASVTVFFLVFFSTLSGVRDVDRQLIDVVLVMGSSRKDILTKVIVPSALSWIFGGLKISIPYAMVGAVTGELMASNKGMGFLIQGSAAYFDTAGVFAGLLALMIVTSILNEVLIRVESRLMRWRRAGSGQVGL